MQQQLVLPVTASQHLAVVQGVDPHQTATNQRQQQQQEKVWYPVALQQLLLVLVLLPPHGNSRPHLHPPQLQQGLLHLSGMMSSSNLQQQQQQQRSVCRQHSLAVGLLQQQRPPWHLG